jgi:hypothetical protein
MTRSHNMPWMSDDGLEQLVDSMFDAMKDLPGISHVHVSHRSRSTLEIQMRLLLSQCLYSVYMYNSSLVIGPCRREGLVHNVKVWQEFPG